MAEPLLAQAAATNERRKPSCMTVEPLVGTPAGLSYS